MIKQPIYESSKQVFNSVYDSMLDLKNEVFKVIYLDNLNHIIDTVDLFEGTPESTPVRPRGIVESAVQHNASALIFVHNHISGEVTPSRSDKQVTRDLVFIGNALQIEVLDHIIIGENRYFSFADEGLIQKYHDQFLSQRIRVMPDTEASVWHLV